MLGLSRYSTWFVIAGLAVLVAAISYQSTRAANVDAEEPDREYSFSLDPDVEILRLQSSANFTIVFSLYGDGRLTVGGPSGPSAEEYQLSYAECDELMRLAVEGGIMEHDKAKMRSIRDKIRAVSYISDGGSIALTVRLETYRGPNHESGAAESVMNVLQPADAARLFPEIADIQAMNEIVQKIRGYRRAGKGLE